MTLIRKINTRPTDNSLLNNFFNSDFFLEPKHVFASRGNEPLINIKETNDAYHIELAAPGYNKTDFEVELDKNILTILVEKEEEATQDYFRKEFSANAFKKSFKLPENKFDDQKIEAKYENGILYVTVNKREEAKPKPKRMISIN